MADPTQLVTADELRKHAAKSRSITELSDPILDEILLWASAFALGFVKKRKVLPLLVWGADLKHAVCSVAYYDCISKRGYDPGAANADTVRVRYDDASGWLLLVSRGDAELIDCVDSSTTPTVDEASPIMASDDIVNWNYQTRGRGCRGGGTFGL